jgi:ferredoxin
MNVCDTCVTRVTTGLEEISPKMQSNLFRTCAPAPVTDMYVCVALLLALLALVAGK